VLPSFPTGSQPPGPHAFFEHAFVAADWPLPEAPYSPHRVFSPNMAFRTGLFREGHRFDTRIGPDGTDIYMTGSETSLTLKLASEGLAPVYLPRSVVRHRIRPDQLDPRWLDGRAFRMGRWKAHRDGWSREGAARRRAVAGDVVRTYWKRLAAGVVGGAGQRLRSRLAYWEARGVLYQCRLGW
jgi:DNA-binding transcriptional LysR family regulator